MNQDVRGDANSDTAIDASADAKNLVASWFDQHGRPVGDYAARRVGADLAGDILADTFRVALEKYPSYDADRGDARAWLFGIATNLIRRHWRTEERRLRHQARSVAGDVVPIDPLVTVDDRLDASAAYQRVVEAVVALPSDDRDLLVLIAWENMTSDQAAAILGIPSGTVRSRLNRIRNQLAGTTQPAGTIRPARRDPASCNKD